MSEQRDLYNFEDDPEVQEAVLAKCDRLGISRSELLREWSRRFIADDTDHGSPEELNGRAESLEVEADELEEEANDYEERANSARERAIMLRKKAKELRQKAENTVPFEERIEELSSEMLDDDDIRLFVGHGKVENVATEFNKTQEEVLDAVQEASGLPDYRCVAGGEPGDTR